MSSAKSRLYPALLRYWRQHRGMSQLDLGLTANVSARHVSFLETGRAEPSSEMVLRLATALRVPLRDRNVMLHAAGFVDAFPEPDLASGLPAPVQLAISRMLEQHEPYPMVIMDRNYDVQRANHGALRTLSQFVAEPALLVPPLNIFRILFDPRLARPCVVDWEQSARTLLARLHLEALERPSDGGLEALIEGLLAYPDVPDAWRQPDFSQSNDSTLTFRLKNGALEAGFITTLTVFNAPGNITLEELRIESYFPSDAATAALCKRLSES